MTRVGFLCKLLKQLLLSEDAIRQFIKGYKASQKLKPESGGSIEKLFLEQSYPHSAGRLRLQGFSLAINK